MRRRWVAGLVAALAVVLLAYGVVHHFTGAGYIEKRLSSAIASANGVNRVRIGSLSFSPLRGSLVARDLEFLPDTLLLAQRGRAGTPAGTRCSITTSSLRVHGIRVWSLVRGRIVADSVAVDGARVDIYLDRTAESVPPALPATLPRVSFRSIHRPIRVGVIRLTNAEISYSEKARDGERPGTIRFADLWATAYNVTNDSMRMTPATPSTIELRARIAGAGRLNATFTYDLLSPRLCMTCSGNIARMSAASLNDLLVNLEGIRITSGVIDSTRFDFKVTDDVASGTMQVLYRDLGIEMLDKVSLDRGLVARLQTFIADKTQLSHANPKDEQTPARTVVIQRERAPEVPVIRFLWETVREGLLSTLGG